MNDYNAIDIINNSEYFDENWYVSYYSDLFDIVMSPAEHYLKIGYLSGRDPSLKFSTNKYLNAYPDILSSNLNPLLHYELHGKIENRLVFPVDSISYPLFEVSDKLNFFSVVIFVNNRTKNLSSALFSLSKQFYRNFEVIIVDNGCTNSIFAQILGYITEQDNVKLISGPYHKLCSFTDFLMHSSNVCAGEYILFLNDNDFWSSDHIAIINNFLNSNDFKFDIVFNNNCFIGSYNNYCLFSKRYNLFVKSIGSDNRVNSSSLNSELFDFFLSSFCFRNGFFYNLDKDSVNSVDSFLSLIRVNIVNTKNFIGFIHNKITFIKLNCSYDYFLSVLTNSDCFSYNYPICKSFINVIKNYCIVFDAPYLINFAEFLYIRGFISLAIVVFDTLLNFYDIDPTLQENIKLRICIFSISIYDLKRAQNLLDSINKSLLAQSKISHCENLYNTAKASRFQIEINPIHNSLLANFCKISLIDKVINLIDYNLLITLNSNNFTHFVFENNNSSRFYVNKNDFDHVSNNGKFLFTLRINLIIFNKVGIVLSDNRFCWLFAVKYSVCPNFIRGKDNWLYLSYDTNLSPQQYKGDYLLSDSDISCWMTYLSSVSKMPLTVFLIPPSKEMVFPQFYPFKRGTICPIDQLLQIFKCKDVNYLYPLDLLKNDTLSYCKTDTHWSSKAAYHVFLLLLDKLKLPRNDTHCPFYFETVKWSGDLGSKCTPFEFSDFIRLVNSKIPSSSYKLTFSNHISFHQQGLITKIFNERAFFNKKILIFCDSFIFSYMLQYFYFYFSNVVAVWSNASIIQSVVNFEKPDYIVLEMAERFIIRTPDILSNIWDYSRTLRVDLSDSDLEYIRNYKSDVSLGIYNDYMLMYKQKIYNVFENA